MAKKLTKEESEKFKQAVDQFKADVNFLESIYARVRMAEKLGINKGNFSKYANGRLTPPQELIDNFYRTYQKHLEWHGKITDEKLFVVQDISAPYGIDYKADLNKINDNLLEIKEMLKRIQSHSTE